MNISDRIADAIEAFVEANGGAVPTLIRLGRLQAGALKEFRDRYSSHPSPGPHGPNYNGIPIEELAVEDHLSVDGTDAPEK